MNAYRVSRVVDPIFKRGPQHVQAAVTTARHMLTTPLSDDDRTKWLNILAALELWQDPIRERW